MTSIQAAALRPGTRIRRKRPSEDAMVVYIVERVDPRTHRHKSDVLVHARGPAWHCSCISAHRGVTMPSGYKPSDVPSRYQPLIDRLAAATGDEVVLTFAEIAALIDRRYLPETAVLHPRWWTKRESAQVRAWTALGWRAHAERDQLRVTFIRLAAE